MFLWWEARVSENIAICFRSILMSCRHRRIYKIFYLFYYDQNLDLAEIFMGVQKNLSGMTPSSGHGTTSWAPLELAMSIKIRSPQCPHPIGSLSMTSGWTLHNTQAYPAHHAIKKLLLSLELSSLPQNSLHNVWCISVDNTRLVYIIIKNSAVMSGDWSTNQHERSHNFLLEVWVAASNSDA